jgi:hypothetical protein
MHAASPPLTGGAMTKATEKLVARVQHSASRSVPWMWDVYHHAALLTILIDVVQGCRLGGVV